MRVGVLSLQGAFLEHIEILNNLGVEAFEIRQLKDIESSFDALVLPGGESTVQMKLLNQLNLLEPLREKINNGLAVLATCAGLILLAKNINNQKQRAFQTLDITVNRNGYGRQLGSFESINHVEGIGEFNMIFIRAPYIERVGENVEILSKVDNKIVAVRCKNQLALSFHPELSGDSSIHKYFISMINE